MEAAVARGTTLASIARVCSSSKRLGSASTLMSAPFFVLPSLSTKLQPHFSTSAKLATNPAATMDTRTSGLIEPDGGVLLDLHVPEAERDSKPAEAATCIEIYKHNKAPGLPYVEEAIANAGNWFFGGDLEVLERIKDNDGLDLSRAEFERREVEGARQLCEERRVKEEQLTMAVAVACPVVFALILPHEASAMAMASGEVLQLAAAELDPSTAKLAISVLGPLFTAFNLLFIIRIVMSWYPQIPVGKFPFSVAYAPTEPVLGPTRRLIPPVGGVDVAPVIWVALMSFLNEILLGQQGLLVLLSQQQP